jgi:LuxR family maltose regulon positive regulatory protein
MVVQQGKLHSAYQIVTQALQRIEDTNSFSPFSATLYGELAQVHYQWHQLDDARTYFLRSVQWSNLGGFSDAEIYHSVFLSRLLQMEGDLHASVQEIEKALNLMKTAAPALVGEEVVAQQVSIFLAVDRIDEAKDALKRYGFSFNGVFSFPAFVPSSGISHPMGLLYNSALRIVLCQMRNNLQPQTVRTATELAELLITTSLACQNLPIALQTLLLRSQLSATLGDDQHRLDDVTKAVELAESEGFISIFVEEGQPIAEALNILRKRNLLGTVNPGYVQEILAAFPKTQSSKAVIGRTVDEDLSPIEPLTPRELEVLQLIAAGDSNQAIAGKLVITLSAVKKHTGNIFNKLNVNSRTQAVAHARLLGLLSVDN